MKFFKCLISYILIVDIIHRVITTSTETNTNSGIFGSFRMMMNNLKKNELTVTKVQKTNNSNKMTPPPMTLGDVAGFNIKSSMDGMTGSAEGKIVLGEPPFFEGWIQYFKYSSDNGLKKPSAFFKNDEYFKQQKEHPTVDFLKEKVKVNNNKDEYKYIPKKTYFYATLFEQTFNIASSREVSIC